MILNRDHLWSFIRDTDLALDPKYSVPGGKLQLAADAATVAARGFGGLMLRSIMVRNKLVYVMRDAPQLVLLRAVNDSLMTSTKMRPSDRDTIIRRLVTVLKEGVLHRVHKFDVKSFFESMDAKALVAQLARDVAIPRVASIQIERFFDELATLGISGIPRGVPLSASLAEYAMQQFDSTISQADDVYYYARFVDDIVVVTGARTSETSFYRYISKRLPLGLEFNHAKTRCHSLAVDRKGTGTRSLGVFDYLGYRFEMFDTTKNPNDHLHRPLEVSISEKKLKRLKSRLCSALFAFAKDGDFDRLNRRLQMLSGNYNIRDTTTRQKRNVGLYCSYRQITNQTNLKEVDSLLRAVVVGNKSDLSRRVRARLTPPQQRKLLSYGFHTSFDARPFYNFTPQEVIDLSRCWQHA